MSQQSMTSENTESIWKPTKKQLEFLRAGSIFEVAYLGGAGSGKSTLAKKLAEHLKVEPKIISFAEPLKRIALQMGWDGKKDEKGRKLLQLLGTECGRDCVDLKIWLKHWVMSVFHSRDFPLIVSDDMRFQNEIDLVKKVGGVTIKITGRNDISEARSAHASEDQASDDCFDFVLNNDGNLGKLDSMVSKVLGELKWTC